MTHNLRLKTALDLDRLTAGDPLFDVRQFTATEAISTLFRVRIEARHPNAAIDFDSVVGHAARFEAETRLWSGIISELELVRSLPDAEGLSTYKMTLVPRMWLLTQRRNYRIFQYKSEVEIAIALLDEWKIPFEVRLDLSVYKGRKYRVQYAETDYEFIYRMLSDVGVTFFWVRNVDGDAHLALADAPHRGDTLSPSLLFHDAPVDGDRAFATNLRKSQRVRPNRVTLRDRDYRRHAQYKLQATATVEANNELEVFYYPENFNFVTDGGDDRSPTADDRGCARTDEGEAARMAQIDLEARRNDELTVELSSNDLRLVPGANFTIEGHPTDDINRRLLVVEAHVAGRFDTSLTTHVEAVSTDTPYRAGLAPKPRIIGVESATVVGAGSEEIHCDEFGRIRVHFHWDRRPNWSEQDSCWIPVSQTWGGAGFGGIQIPRVGQEVLVEFLNGDPDRPIVTGRVYTAVNPCPAALPAGKTQTIIKSNSTGGGGGHCHIVMEDRAGNERLDMRSQKDMNVLVLNNRSSKIGGNESRTIVNNRTTVIGAHDVVTTKGDCVRKVGANWLLGVQNDATFAAKNNIAITGKNVTETAGEVALYAAGDKLTLEVGESKIEMLKHCIIITSAKVDINPAG